MESRLEAFDNLVKSNLSYLDNEYVTAALSLFLIIYAGLAAPKLPESVAKLFDYTAFKLVIFFGIVYVSRKNPTVALIASVGLLVSLMTLNRYKLNREMMTVVGNQGSAEVYDVQGVDEVSGNYELDQNYADSEVQPMEHESSLSHSLEEVWNTSLHANVNEASSIILDEHGGELENLSLSSLSELNVQTEDMDDGEVRGFSGTSSFAPAN
jgi:hypothetical protein